MVDRAQRPALDAELVLLRHGESAANAARSFTGWRDAPLTARGVEEARAAGRALAALGFSFDEVWSSCLSRAVDTAALVRESCGAVAPTRQDWRFNERHCGAFQGRTKDECRRQFGETVLRDFRERWEAQPPLAPVGSEDDPRATARYAEVRASLPRGESLRELAVRVELAYTTCLRGPLAAGRRVLVVAHAISLRALARAVLADGGNDAPAALPPLALANGDYRVFDFDGLGRARLRPPPAR